MDEITLTALRGSIAKWKAIVDGTGSDNANDNCPLCKEFPDEYCTGCPVSQKTRLPGCIGSPYIKFFNLFLIDDEWPHFATTLKQKTAAQAELDFLISLLPEGEAACVEVDGAARA